ncbi:hypothetical protein ACLMJK_002733 [Lecanora helva]
MSGSSQNCPSGLRFYTCNSNNFAGCCSVDPCNSSGCPSNESNNGPEQGEATSRIPEQGKATSRSISASPTTSSQNLPTAAASSSTQFDAAASSSALASASATSTGDSRITFLFTSVHFVSQVVVTPTSNGIAMQPKSSVITSTKFSTLSTITAEGYTTRPFSTSPTASSSASPSSGSTPSATASGADSHTPAIAGSIGGAAGFFIAVIFIWLLLRWRKHKKENEARAPHYDDDPRLQGIDANRAGDAFKDEDVGFTGGQQCEEDTLISPVEKGRRRELKVGSPPYLGQNHGVNPAQWPGSSPPISPQSIMTTNNHTSNANAAYQPSTSRNGLSPSSANLRHDPGGPKAELSGEGAPSISELSPTPERSPINTSKRAAVPAYHGSGFGSERSPPADEAAMQPSLDTSLRSPDEDSAEAEGRRQHIMSWMEYDGNNPGPAR